LGALDEVDEEEKRWGTIRGKRGLGKSAEGKGLKKKKER